MADKLRIKVKANGKMDVKDDDGTGDPQPTGDAVQVTVAGAAHGRAPEITLPPGATVVEACIVVKTNPQCCAWCLINGAWQRKCWQC
jgi:hypothetical protein